MPAEALSTTTLGQALDKSENAFFVASTTDMSVGDFIVARAEAMKVQEILNSTQVRVKRGVSGTLARPHANSQRVFIGSPHKFQAIRESLTAIVGDSGTYPEFMLPGQRAKDDQGNEYILLAPANQVFAGSSVLISIDGLFTCSHVFGDDQGSVAVMVEGCLDSQYAWGQIYGLHELVQDASQTSGATDQFFALAQTSITSPVVGMAAAAASEDYRFVISGMFIVGAASTATTLATTHSGVTVPCWLNYPYVARYGALLQTSAGV